MAGIILSGVVTIFVPEAGVGEAGLEATGMLYSMGSFFRSSASVSRYLQGSGNGSGAALGALNDAAMAAVGVPESMKPTMDQIMSAIESKLGIDAGDQYSC